MNVRLNFYYESSKCYGLGCLVGWRERIVVWDVPTEQEREQHGGQQCLCDHKYAFEAALGVAAFDGEGENSKEEAGGEEYGLLGTVL